MKRSDLHLIKYALAGGNTISVWDGEEWQVKRSTSYKAIKAAVDSVGDSTLRIRNSVGEELASAYIIPFNGSPDEYVSDYSYNDYMIAWDKLYMAEIMQ